MSAEAETTVEVRYMITVHRTSAYVALESTDNAVAGEPDLSREVVKRKIYSQTVSELDLPALVSVVNGLGKG